MLLRDMRDGCDEFLLRAVNRDAITAGMMRQADVVALHVARAAWQMLSARDELEIGVVFDGEEHRVCKGAAVGKTRSGQTPGGCRLLWKFHLLASRYATAFVMAAVNEDWKRQKVLHKHLWAQCKRICWLECKRHCWENMRSPMKRLPDAPRKMRLIERAPVRMWP